MRLPDPEPPEWFPNPPADLPDPDERPRRPKIRPRSPIQSALGSPRGSG